MTHLTPDQLVDALDGVLEPARQSHHDTCQPCQQQVAELAAVLRETRAVDMPEPSPLYWQQLSAGVSTAIDAEPVAVGGWGGWRHWPVLAPVAALALLVMAVAVPRPSPVMPDVALREASEAPLDASLAVVADLVGDIDWDTAMSAGLTVAPGAADQAVWNLTAAEQQELTRLLRVELLRTKS